MKTVIIDYGSGNLRSAEKSVIRAASEGGINADVRVTSSAHDVRNADRVILPGVGAFADCMQGLTKCDDMVGALQYAVIEKARPFLGICVGMQLLADYGLEHNRTVGLGWIQGSVQKLTPSDEGNYKIPHMGWNELNITNAQHSVLDGIENGDHAYFVHSFQFLAKNQKNIYATVNYDQDIAAIIGRDNIIGTQFHPEKSQQVGLKFLTNFLRWAP
jgi:imidazole glycerol-phosphate synthase subunit HisH